MPNRGEIALPPVSWRNVAAVSDEVWTVIGFCAIGALISIYFAASFPGFDMLSGSMVQLG